MTATGESINIFLPGLSKQFEISRKHINYRNKKVLLIGSGLTRIAELLIQDFEAVVSIIIDRQDIVYSERLSSQNNPAIRIRFMDYLHTDFPDSEFDIVFAQASICRRNRGKIFKELRRISKADAQFVIGEPIALTDDAPVFIKDVWKAGGISPLTDTIWKNEIIPQGIEIVHIEDLTSTLKTFYKRGAELMNKTPTGEFEKEPILKKQFIQLKHEVNAYLKLGGLKYTGFKVFFLRKAV